MPVLQSLLHHRGTEPPACPGAAEPSAILTAVGAVVYDWNVTDDLIAWGSNALDVLGLRDAGAIATGEAYRRMFLSRSHPSRANCAREDLLARGGGPDKGGGVPYSLLYELQLPDGPAKVEDVGRWFAGPGGHPARARGLLRVARRGAGGLEGGQGFDGLGADARAALLRRLEEAASEGERRFALIVASVVGLSRIEDLYGSEVCEEVVRTVIARARGLLRGGDLVVRYATNRIGIVLGRCGQDELPRAAARLAQRAALPSEGRALSVPIALACGGVSAERVSGDARELLHRAEAAREEARGAGIPFAAPSGGERGASARREGRAAAEDLVLALNERRVVLARQPVLAAGSRKVAFHEALLRVRSARGEIVGAAAAVPVFEAMGRIELVDFRVLELAIGDLVLDPALRLSVNVSAPTLRASPWLDRLSAALVRHPSIAGRLVVELTESQAIEDVAATKRVFSTLRAWGIGTAIDDFGAGHSSFRHLRGFEVDILKIDGAFVQNVGRSPDDGFFVRTLVDLAGHLGVETVAEWVRDEGSARMLAEWGVTYLQGDALGPARVPKDEDGADDEPAEARSA